jgi:integrase
VAVDGARDAAGEGDGIMKGSTIKRGDGKTPWSYIIELPRGEAGKRRQQWKSGFATEREADVAMRDALAKLDRGQHVEASKETLAQFMRRWLPSAKASIKPTTYAKYATLAEKYVIPGIGQVRLQKLTPAALNAFYADVLDHGRIQHKGGLSAATVGHVHGVIRLALSEGVRWRDLASNPALDASPPRKTRPGMKTWSAPEAQSFLRYVADDRLYACYALALGTGMRKGELLGLAWRDINMVDGWINVRQTIVSVDFKIQRSTPKTKAGRRSIALDASMIEILRAHRLRQLKERDLMGLPAQQPDDLAFSQPDGSPLHPGLFTDTFDRRVKAAGVSRIRFHDVRHTAASLMLAQGAHPKIVSERLGHASVSITLDLYSHSVPSLQQDAAAKLGSLLFSS